MNWLRKQMKKAFEDEKCDRYLLNHLAFFEERISSKVLFDLKSQCKHCNQFINPKNFKRHQERCESDMYTVWLKDQGNIPTVQH